MATTPEMRKRKVGLGDTFKNKPPLRPNYFFVEDGDGAVFLRSKASAYETIKNPKASK